MLQCYGLFAVVVVVVVVIAATAIVTYNNTNNDYHRRYFALYLFQSSLLQKILADEATKRGCSMQPGSPVFAAEVGKRSCCCFIHIAIVIILYIMDRTYVNSITVYILYIIFPQRPV